MTDEYHNTTTNNIIRHSGRNDLSVIDVNIGSCAIIKDNKNRGFLPDKMLYNIGLDATSTDLVCVSPSNVVFGMSDAGMFEKKLELRGMKERKKSEDTEVVERKEEEEKEEMKGRTKEGNKGEEKGEEEVQKQRQKQGQRQLEDEEEKEEGVYTPRALIVPVYYTSAHENTTNTYKTLQSQNLKNGISSVQPEDESTPVLMTQSAAVTVPVIMPMTVLSSTDPRSAPLPFPLHTTQCGQEQSTKLLKAYIGTSDQPTPRDPGGLEKVSFNAQVMPLSSPLVSSPRFSSPHFSSPRFSSPIN